MSREYVLQPFRAPIQLQIDYARELNPQQHAAVVAPPGPALVIAGAGSGKTRTLTYRVAFLLEQGIPPDRILLLTFTNKAAREMMRRVEDLLGGQMSSLWGGTFHSVGHRILRRHADLLGYPRHFTILDREDARDLIAAALADANIDPAAYRFPKPDLLGDIFSLTANTGEPASRVVETHYPNFGPVTDEIEDVGRRYAARKREAGAVDFDDLLVQWLKLLRDHADVLEAYQRRFQFILVDEYQDTNRLQGDLIDLLAARHHNLMVVGDDSQSIYSWRGADFQNILRFPERYPEAVIYKIETNYRSTPEILTLANAAIAPNLRQFAKQLVPARRSGPKPAVVPCNDSAEQAAFVAQRALQLRDEGTRLDDIAVLYRSHFHALELQLELTRRNIPFSITSGIRFFEQAHVKDLAAYLKLVCNPRDELAFKRLVKLLPGVGGRTADRLWQAFDTGLRGAAPDVPSPAPAPDSAPAPGSDSAPGSAPPAPDSAPAPAGPASAPASAPGPLIAAALQKCGAAVPKKAEVAWAQFATTIAQLEDASIRNAPARMMTLALEAEYLDYLRANYTNSRARQEDLEQLARFAGQFASTEDFLGELALLSNLEAEGDRPSNPDDERLRLSTIHQAKGLEFAAVFVIMLCDGAFPSDRSLDRPEDEEEERRLFYVAITRAKNDLFLTYPLIRAMKGSAEAMTHRSRFLNELPPDVREEWNLRPPRFYG